MGFKTFNAGDVLTASDVNTYLMKQAVIACTSGSRPSSPVEGMVIYQTDTDSLHFYTGSAWKRFARDIETATAVEAFQGANDSGLGSSYGTGTLHGVAFVAPPSGSVSVTFSGWIGSNAVAGAIGDQVAFLSDHVRTGSTVGSGTDVLVASDVRSVVYFLTSTGAGYKYGQGLL